MTPPIMERIMAADKVHNAKEDVTYTVVQSGSDDTEHNLHLPPKSVVKPVSDTKGEMTNVLADRGVVTRTSVQAIVEKAPGQLDQHATMAYY